VLRPEFVTRPSPQSVDLTQIATFTCSVTGYNVQYEWRIGSGSFPGKVTGINTNTLVIPDVRSSDGNTYSCIVLNEAGSRGGRSSVRLTVTGMTMIMLLGSSVNVVLMVTGLPEVIVMPSSQSIEVTHNATFTTTVSGVRVEYFMYQWRHNGTLMVDEISDTLIITDVMTSDAGEYNCIVTNEFEDSDMFSSSLTVTGMI